jgi:hypothetical protein
MPVVMTHLFPTSYKYLSIHLPHSVHLHKEPANPHDPSAVKVCFHQQQDRNTWAYIEHMPLGYLPREVAKTALKCHSDLEVLEWEVEMGERVMVKIEGVKEEVRIITEEYMGRKRGREWRWSQQGSEEENKENNKVDKTSEKYLGSLREICGMVKAYKELFDENEK